MTCRQLCEARLNDCPSQVVNNEKHSRQPRSQLSCQPPDSESAPSF